MQVGKFKIKVYDKRVISLFAKILGVLSTLLSFYLIFCDIPDKYKGKLGLLIFTAVIVLLYLIIYLYANFLTMVKVEIGGSTVVVKKGDIFEEEGLKVIPFNEYFDTVVDDKIISKKSLNGQYIERIYKDTVKLDQLIENDEDLNEPNKISKKNVQRRGKSTKYKLGSSIVVEDYVLTAFTYFNEQNKAVLSMVEYINFLLEFWNEINRVYAQKSVTVPIFGSGITRFKGKFYDIEVDELLMIMLWTFRLSETRFSFPAKLTIVIYEDLFDRIDIFSLKEDIS